MFLRAFSARVATASKLRLGQRFFGRPEVIEVVLVDMRSRELIIKGQEILTADKVALRVSIVVQFAVIDPKAAVHAVESFQGDRGRLRRRHRSRGCTGSIVPGQRSGSDARQLGTNANARLYLSLPSDSAREGDKSD